MAQVAERYHMRIASQWKGDEIARSDERMKTVRGMASMIANGGNVAIACVYLQGKRFRAKKVLSLSLRSVFIIYGA